MEYLAAVLYRVIKRFANRSGNVHGHEGLILLDNAVASVRHEKLPLAVKLLALISGEC